MRTMRRILAAFFLIAFVVSSSFAATVGANASHDGAIGDAGQSIFPINGAGTEGPLVGKCSTGVYVSWFTNIAGYALKTLHGSGVKRFGSSADSTAIVWKAISGAKGQPIGGLSGYTNADLINEGGWSVM